MTGETWAKVLGELGGKELAVGLKRCATRADAWPPSLPEFRELCRLLPADIGAPSTDSAFSEAIRQSYPYAPFTPWSHKCVYWAAVHTGMSELNESQHLMRKAFEREYMLAIEQHEQLAEPPKAVLPAKTHKVSEDERQAAAQAAIAEMHAILEGARAG